MLIKTESDSDIADIHDVITKAFIGHPHSDNKEQFIVDELRAKGALAVSLVAVENDKVIGHIAFSMVKVGNENVAYFGLGPISVLPEWQKQGVGKKLMQSGLEAIKTLGAKGCVVLGDSNYYQDYGFNVVNNLVFPGVPAEYFMAISFDGDNVTGEVSYHPAFFI